MAALPWLESRPLGGTTPKGTVRQVRMSHFSLSGRFTSEELPKITEKSRGSSYRLLCWRNHPNPVTRLLGPEVVRNTYRPVRLLRTSTGPGDCSRMAIAIKINKGQRRTRRTLARATSTMRTERDVRL